MTGVRALWCSGAASFRNDTLRRSVRLKLSLDRPGLGATLESTRARSRRDKFAIAFAAYRMPRASTTLLLDGHRSVEKQSCKRQNNNGRPKYQNVCLWFWSAAFVLIRSLRLSAQYTAARGGRFLSCLGGPFICHSIIRKWQSEVPGHFAASGEGGQLRESSRRQTIFFLPRSSRVNIYCESVAEYSTHNDGNSASRRPMATRSGLSMRTAMTEGALLCMPMRN